MAFDKHDMPRRAWVGIPVDAAALFLDLDGTIAGIEATPGAVVADGERSSLLRRAAAATRGRLAVISGRTLHDIDRIVDHTVPFASGVHGLEHRGVAGVVIADAHPALGAAGEALRAYAAGRSGLVLEDKGVSLALHYRQAPHEARAIVDLGRRIAADTGLALQVGDCVVELRTPGRNKGDAVRAFMASAPFAGGQPIFLGDDATDEDAFRAVRALGGAGVLVGPARETAALARLDGVPEVFAWLDRSLRDGVFRVEARS